MIRNRTFELQPKNESSTWTSFSEAYEYFKNHKDKISTSFGEAAYDKNFDEPMNYFILECDARNIHEMNLMSEYQTKFNELFAENDKDILISMRVTNLGKAKDRVCISHTWFVKINF